MAKEISTQRKTLYYLGLVLMVIGGLLFFSVFVTTALSFGNLSSFGSNIFGGLGRALAGMALLVVGGILRQIGARGLAGSGVILDPEQARSELEPYSRMAGGMVKDALGEADIKLGGGSTEKVIMIKCRACGTLNEDGSKFCQECGVEL